MPSYRRNYQGRCFFFTLVTHERRKIFADGSARRILREAIERTQQQRPWQMEAIVLLPDHLHMLWRMTRIIPFASRP
ncbi:MAG: transposase [Planctomycetota bacterium]|jgi:putative transposase